MTNRTIPVTLPEWMWGRLATIGEHRKEPIADLIGGAIVALLKDDPHRLSELVMELKAARDAGYMNPSTRKDHK